MWSKESVNTDYKEKKQLPVLTLKGELISVSHVQMRAHSLVLGKINYISLDFPKEPKS